MKAAKWTSESRTLGEIPTAKMNTLQQAVTTLQEATEQFQIVSDKGNRTSILETGRKLQGSVQALREAQRDVASIVDGNMEGELSRYLGTLKKLEALQG